MCGIFACISNSPKVAENISKIGTELLLLSESRGKQASGIAGISKGRIDVLRSGEKASLFARQPKYLLFLKEFQQKSLSSDFCTLLGHTRLATNGRETVSTNNQPVVTEKTIGLHNGMVVNEKELWKKYSSLQQHFTVDTELILQLVEYFVAKGGTFEQAIAKSFYEIKGAASVIIMHSDFPMLIAATNTGSLYCAQNNLFTVWASERYYIEQVSQKFQLELSSISQLSAGNALALNFKTQKLRQFILKKMAHSNITNHKYQDFFSISVQDLIPTFFHSKEFFCNTLSVLQTHTPNLDAIKKLRRCTRCILPITMPMITFDSAGVCNYCLGSKKISYQGKHKLEQLVQPIRKVGRADCIVALSGGRDSSFGLHYAKTVLKLNPIAYTYDWGMVTDIARRNQYRLTAELGVEHIIVSADINQKREFIKKNVEAWLAKPNLAMIPLFMAGDKQAEYYCEQVRKRTGIDLIIYCRGNELEDERFKFGYYGIFNGTPGGVLHNLSLSGKLQMATYFGLEYLRNLRYFNSSLFDTAGAYFSAYLMQHAFIYLWHYIPWKETEIITTLKKLYGWETPKDTIATWRIDDGTPPFYNYIYYQVQGFTEHDALRSNQVRQGVITRAKALELAAQENQPRYEALKWYFDSIQLNGHKALSVIDAMQKRY